MSYPCSENKGADQTARMRRLTCAYGINSFFFMTWLISKTDEKQRRIKSISSDEFGSNPHNIASHTHSPEPKARTFGQYITYIVCLLVLGFYGVATVFQSYDGGQLT